MTIAEALSAIKATKPSQYGDDMLVSWLSQLDGRLWQDVFSQYKREGPPPSLPYPAEEGDTALLVPFPHDDLYLKWLGAQIDYNNGEFARYQNAMEMFNAQMEAFSGAWNRENGHLRDSFIQI